jgi:predicted DNA-binding antitoxin AbrB/MazE fold protein
MTQIDAIYRDGIFQPLQPVELVDQQRVRLSFQSIQANSPEAWLSHVRRLQTQFVARKGLLPDSTPDIAADRLR